MSNANILRMIVDSDALPAWAEMRPLLSNELLSLPQAGYLPFIPHPVTPRQHSIVCTAMRNFVCLAGQLDQELLAVICDEGVFRIALDTFLRRPDEFCFKCSTWLSVWNTALESLCAVADQKMVFLKKLYSGRRQFSQFCARKTM